MIVFLVIFVFGASFTFVSTASTCGSNEVYVDCRQICPPQSCNISYTEYSCDPPPACEPGCNCIENYLRDGNGVCIKNDDCPPPPQPCGENEIQSDCKQTCPPQRCDYDPKKLACKPGPCQPGCNCIDGYLRNSDGLCVAKQSCPKARPDCGENATPAVCTKQCPPQTCASLLVSTNRPCIPGPCRRGCNCKDGYLKDADGNCILKENCPKNIAGQDESSVGQESYCESSVASSSSSSSSSDTNSQSSTSSKDNAYVVNSDTPASETEGTNNCRQNETYVYCNAGCPTNYCPTNDGRGIIACSPPWPCPPGCACKANYKRLSVEDNRCILASECPPVTCTRPHEVWYPCPAPCFSDSCRALGVERECYSSGCEPQCACEEGYYRNDSGDCVLQENC
ncbi:unnamed protein product [Colias eurytheme]|nr:unnamed protein product [Colias eurytheme]